ncbi:MAG: hypothetical protein ACYC2W_06950 [Desulfurivibrionaceae bacterium]
MTVFEENFFLHGVENNETGVDIPQNIGKNAGGVAESFIRRGWRAVFALQQSFEKSFYQEKSTMGQKETDCEFPPW